MNKKQIRALAEDIAYETELFAGIDINLVAYKYAKEAVDDHIAAKSLTLLPKDRVCLINEVFKVTARAEYETCPVTT